MDVKLVDWIDSKASLPSWPSVQHPSPSTLHPAPFTQHPSPSTLHPALFAQHSSPSTHSRPACWSPYTADDKRASEEVSEDIIS
ncbi:hypothetical protein GE09DRAFT_706867 [Coniochaeta sp. 2T2.1]|nr:hypothetical protein GE09DRAFT_706867 [Coniochaeta sp. 2T2.1]